MHPTPQSTQEQRQRQTDPSVRSKHLIFAAATILYWTTLYIYVPILSPYLHERGLSMGWIGFILGSYGLTQVVIRFPLGIYSDAMTRRKPFLVIGMLAGLISCLFFLLPGTWGGPLAGRLMAGVCAAAWVPFTVLYASYYPSNQTHQTMGTLSFLTVFGQLAGMSASGWLASSGNWNTAFLSGVGIAAVGTLVAFFVYEPRSQQRPPSARPPAKSPVSIDKAIVAPGTSLAETVARLDPFRARSRNSLHYHVRLHPAPSGRTRRQRSPTHGNRRRLHGSARARLVLERALSRASLRNACDDRRRLFSRRLLYRHYPLRSEPNLVGHHAIAQRLRPSDVLPALAQLSHTKL